MRPKFREDKATQAAALMLAWSGGSMNYMKLIKLLYLADRSALLARGRPITFAKPFSMRHGPVLSEVLDLINEGNRPGAASVWTDVVSAPESYSVRLRSECPADDLSDAEETLLREVFDAYGAMEPWALVEHLHKTLPEWIPTDGAIPIQYSDILRQAGRTDAEVAELDMELEDLALLERLRGSRDLLPA